MSPAPLSPSVPSRLGTPLFSFALFSDTHYNAGPETVPERYQHVNDQNDHIIRRINRDQPAFAVHLGDIVSPLDHFPSRRAAVQRAQNSLAELTMPLRLVPGNHDIGDKPAHWLRAPTVNQKALAGFRNHWGPLHAAFDQGPCRFILLNTPVLNSGLAAEYQQWSWLSAQLNTDRRCFLLLHYPPFIHQPDEPAHYENLDEPARSHLLHLVNQHAIEAVFSGHTHQPFYDRHGDTDLYVLPSTAFFRPEYGEFFAVAPKPGDKNHLGYALVRIYETGHVLHYVPSRGRTGPAPVHVSPHPTPENPHAPLGLYLRHRWDETVTLPQASNLDELSRKNARNDHTLIALCNLGVQCLRLPLSDLTDPATQDRLSVLKRLGFEITLSLEALPDDETVALMKTHRNCFDAVEVTLPWRRLPHMFPALDRLRQTLTCPVFLTRMVSWADPETGEPGTIRYYRYGITPDRLDALGACFGVAKPSRYVDGITLEVAPELAPWTARTMARRPLSDPDLKRSFHVRLSPGANEAAADDDVAIASRVAEAAAVGLAFPGESWLLDTVVDHDRGHGLRHALLDRRYTPRPAYHALAHLTARWGGTKPPPVLTLLEVTEDLRVFSLETSDQKTHLYLPQQTGVTYHPLASDDHWMSLTEEHPKPSLCSFPAEAPCSGVGLSW